MPESGKRWYATFIQVRASFPKRGSRRHGIPGRLIVPDFQSSHRGIAHVERNARDLEGRVEIFSLKAQPRPREINGSKTLRFLLKHLDGEIFSLGFRTRIPFL